MCQMYVLRCLSTYHCTCIYMSCPGGTEWHIKNISLVPRENRCLYSVVDHFRCRRTNSSCNHAHISVRTKTGNFNFPHLPAHPLHNPRYLPLPQLSSAHSLSLSLSLRLSHSLRAQQLSFESRVHWTWPCLSRVRQRSLSEKLSAGLSENLLDICLGHAATHSTTSHAQACLPKYYLQRRVAPHHTPGTCQTECVR